MPDQQIYELELPDGRILEFTDVATMKAAAAKFTKPKEQPLTLERGAPPSAVKVANEPPPYMAIADAVGNASKSIADYFTNGENLPALGGLAGGLAAAPFTSGMSAIPAIALASGGAALGGALGAGGRAMDREQRGIPQTLPGVAGDMASQAALQGGTQAVGGTLARGVGAGLQAGGRALYGLGLRPEIKALTEKFPGVTRGGLTDAGIRGAVPITQEGAEQAAGMVRASEGAVDHAITGIPRGTTVPSRPILGTAGAARPVIREAQQRAAGNAAVRPVFRNVRTAGASHGDNLTPRQLLDMQRATSRQAGSVAGVMPQIARPTPGRMNPNLVMESNRAMAGAAQDTLEGLAPGIAPIQAQLPTQGALEAAITAATQREPVSHYMIAQAAAPLGGAVLGGMAGGVPGGLMGGAAGAAAAGLLTNPATLGNAGILAGRAGMGLAGSTGQIPANLLRGAINAATPNMLPDSTALPTPTPAPQANTNKLDPGFVSWLSLPDGGSYNKEGQTYEQSKAAALQNMGALLQEAQPTATPVDPNTGFRLIPREDYWTPR